jgi:phosphatidylserine/phosphatidylglycerophosphate/cardiolipin synthase-like enzyme
VKRKDGPSPERLIIQPDDGIEPVRELVDGARQSLHVKQFTLTEPSLLEALVRAHRRGVRVRVMLNPHRSSGDRANDESFAGLQRAGVPVEWTSPDFAVTHEKSLVVDARRALVSTFNLAEKYFTQTRDYGIVTDDPVHAAEIIRCFEADWRRERFDPDHESGLAWSSANSRSLMAQLIDAARERLDVQHPKYVDATILDRLADARDRGVHVRILCGGKHGISAWDIPDTFSSLRILRRTGVKVRRQKHPKLHAKLIVADDETALVGSMNIDRSAFDLRRELGVFIGDRHAVHRLQEVFEHDWHRAEHWEAPDPLAVDTHEHGELPHDPEFKHE